MADEAPDLVAIHTGRPSEGLVFAPGGSGWCRYSAPRYPGNSQVFVRFAHTGAGSALTVREIHFAFMAGLGTRSLRELPLGRLEAAANQPEHYATLAGRITATSAAVVPFPEDTFTEEGWPWWMYTIPAPRRAPRLKVKVPQGHRKPDRFYEQIGERFAYLATVSPRPATDLAKANGVPVTTVHGWVKEARRRRLLPAGERSRKQEKQQREET